MMNRIPLHRLLDLAQQAFDFADDAPLQRVPAAALHDWLHPAGMPREPHPVAAWIETRSTGRYTPPPAPYPLNAALPLLIDLPAQSADRSLVSRLLALRYPGDHRLRVALVAADAQVTAVHTVELSGLPALLAAAAPENLMLIFVPALAPAEDRRGAESLRWVMARLLGPGGCPWDVRQSHQDLRKALLEETYEVLEAIDASDLSALSEELGDLLISIFAHSEMARQAGHFSIEDVFEQVVSKLIRRHPHVFAELAVAGESDVLYNWEQIKARERAEKGRKRTSLLDGLPPDLPALAAAQKLATRAARAGFDWPVIDLVWAKLQEELTELREAQANPDHAGAELGDVLFVLAVLARWLDLDAEASLRETNARFRRRFARVEQGAAATGRILSDLSLDEMLALWAAAKDAERTGQQR
jgi:tetrapyrrole methylase family protein/MazG family protein